ncbi:permease prefix domain 1-containing protein [Isachenkonia alkalipeptolytica]|uniref:Uncharacterized protein n=1 Tax=Isachenkonia alkalipeptolytica TaxID=2565777 RepID=A0AA43XJV6_9CLOT|nr:permease prefix domain 1-containing protein [Isachenkonia alkalipeptolytica]NBG87691.1 hypothetical protein [Isachenkonia alkalipeptolytica]
MKKKEDTADQIFIDKVLKEVRFSLVKPEIKKELQDHIEDKKEDFFLKDEMTEEEALKKTIEEMGEPVEIGKSLNEVHHPILGWALVLSKGLAILMVGLTIFSIYTELHRGDFYGQPAPLDSGKILAEVSIDEEITLDHRTLYFDRAIFQEPDEVIVLMKSTLYTRGPRNHHLFFESVSNVKEEENYHYLANPYQTRFFWGKLALTLYGADFNAETITLSYDQANRKFEIEIPVPEGVSSP